MPLCQVDALQSEYDLCVIGAGPAGLACALRAHDRGLRVLLLEAGGKSPIPGEPDVIAAEIKHPRFHDAHDIIAAPALGGSSHWWGGRCTPFDRADFRHWPIAYEDMESWWNEAAGFLGARALSESPPPGAFAKLTQFDASRDETWAPELNMARRWRARLYHPNGPAILLHARVTSIALDGARVSHLDVRVGAATHQAKARQYVLTCGGLGSVRLLLLAQRQRPQLCGGAEGPLGRGYMGHLTGTIADLAPADPNDAHAFATRPLGGDVFARRRLRPRDELVLNEGVANTAFWLESSNADNPRHGSAVGSAKYLAARLAKLLRGKRDDAPLGPHLDNVAAAPLAAGVGLTHAMGLLAYARITGRHPRGAALIPAAPGRWHLFYHAEQARDPRNRITLSDARDSIGLPKLHIDFEMRLHDFDAIVRAHDLLDADLRNAGAGALHWSCAPGERAAYVAESARDGYHQMGGACMHPDPAHGVVDTDLRVHGLANLSVASGGVFPSGGQANPTMTIVALALRLADRLAARENQAALSLAG
ncbi:MAG TPA: GMC family oxidoreductase [Caulobacterales bacterium]|nr:GMC family oxidoreductase [Caulobacterales bacterium]